MLIFYQSNQPMRVSSIQLLDWNLRLKVSSEQANFLSANAANFSTAWLIIGQWQELFPAKMLPFVYILNPQLTGTGIARDNSNYAQHDCRFFL
jgi:hypothetical protein